MRWPIASIPMILTRAVSIRRCRAFARFRRVLRQRSPTSPIRTASPPARRRTICPGSSKGRCTIRNIEAALARAPSAAIASEAKQSRVARVALDCLVAFDRIAASLLLPRIVLRVDVGQSPGTVAADLHDRLFVDEDVVCHVFRNGNETARG